jgi:hypothetical protein
MLDTTRRRTILVALLIALSVAIAAIAGYQVRQAVLVGRLSDIEKKVVGAWSWTYIEGVGRMIFSADHRVKEGFPPDDLNKPAVHDRDFTYLLSGTWRVDGDVLVTDIDNHLLIEHFRRSSLEKPEFDRTSRRDKIVTTDENKIVLDGNHSLERVHP